MTAVRRDCSSGYFLTIRVIFPPAESLQPSPVEVGVSLTLMPRCCSSGLSESEIPIGLNGVERGLDVHGSRMVVDGILDVPYERPAVGRGLSELLSWAWSRFHGRQAAAASSSTVLSLFNVAMCPVV